jgi:hypothetical protein
MKTQKATKAEILVIAERFEKLRSKVGVSPLLTTKPLSERTRKELLDLVNSWVHVLRSSLADQAITHEELWELDWYISVWVRLNLSFR